MTDRPLPRVFRDDAHQRAYEREGYVVVPGLDAGRVDELLARYRALPTVDDSGFFASLFTPSREYKARAHEAVVDAGAELCDRYLVDYRPLIGNFVTKRGGAASLMPPHQDWTFVDESRFASINLWCPLVDVDRRNGALYLLAGGHHLPFTLRGTAIPPAFGDVTGLTWDHLVYLPMKAGELLLYDHRLVHASPPNETGEVRVAAAIAAVPAAATPLHFFADPETGAIERHEVGLDFFLDYTWGPPRLPASAGPGTPIAFDPPAFDEAQVAPFYRRAPSPWRRAFDRLRGRAG